MRQSLRLGLCAIFSVLLVPVAAKTEPLSLAHSLKTAQDQQFDFQNTAAIRTLESALASFNASDNPNRGDLEKLADAYLFLALCHKNEGKNSEMRANLFEAARLNPNLSPDEHLFPPSLLDEFDRAKDQIWTKGQFAPIRINSNPEEASVFVNGAFKGKTPLQINRQPLGMHYISVRKEKEEVLRKIRLEAGKTEVVEVKFRKRR